MPWDEEYKALEAEVERLRGTIRDGKQQLVELERERDEARAIIEWGCQQVWEGCDIDGGDWQGTLEAAGMLVNVPASEEFKAEHDYDTMQTWAWSDAATRGEGEGTPAPGGCGREVAYIAGEGWQYCEAFMLCDRCSPVATSEEGEV